MPQHELIIMHMQKKKKMEEMVQKGYKFKRQEFANTMMGGIADFLATITEQ